MIIYIKSHNPRFSTGMVLDGDKLSGDTYRARENIKKFWDGKWDAIQKVWIVNPQKVLETLNSKYNWGLEISEEEIKVEKPRGAYDPSRWCVNGELGEDF